MRLIFRLLTCAFLTGFPLYTSASETALPDVRLVVDISGSMKQNDPHNLRRPAVRLITELLPAGSRAGVWTFGEYVNMLVSHGLVDEDWRQLALSRADEINSVALRTNIGGALEVASDDFYRKQGREDTHFILLTDGMVDVAPANAEDGNARNRAERDRILRDIIPALAQKGARLHTIALSSNADQPLLRQLAQATGGSYSIAESDQDLSRAFLNALDRAGATEEVPLDGNSFTIDESIKEFTAVIFHAGQTSGLGLRSPAGDERYRAQPGAESDVRWVAGHDYSLVTVEDPAGGEWQLLGELGEGTRVKIVSDLKMAVSELPGYFFAAEEVPLTVAFEASQEIITDPDFLRFLTVTVSLQTADGRSGTKVISDADSVPADGVYRDVIARLKEPGEYRFTITADGQTFKRQSRQTIVLRPPVEVVAEGQGTGNDSRYELHVSVAQPNLVPDKTRLVARVEGPDSGKELLPLTPGDTPGQWRHTLLPEMGRGEYVVTVEFEGETAHGERIDYTARPLILNLPRNGGGADYQAAALAAPDPASQAPPQPGASLPQGPAPDNQTQLVHATPEVEDEGTEAPGNIALAGQASEDTEESGEASLPLFGAAGALLVAILLGGGAFWYRKKKQSGGASGAPSGGDEMSTEPDEPTEAMPEFSSEFPPESAAEAGTAAVAGDAVSESESESEPEPEPGTLPEPQSISAEDPEPRIDESPAEEETSDADPEGEPEDMDTLVDNILAENDSMQGWDTDDSGTPDFDDDEFTLEDLDLSDADEEAIESEAQPKDEKT